MFEREQSSNKLGLIYERVLAPSSAATASPMSCLVLVTRDSLSPGNELWSSRSSCGQISSDVLPESDLTLRPNGRWKETW